MPDDSAVAVTYMGAPADREAFDSVVGLVERADRLPYEGLVRGNATYMTVELYDPAKGHHFRATDTPEAVREQLEAWLREHYSSTT